MALPSLVSRNGRLIAPAQAWVSVFNPALYGSFGIYESLQVVAGVPFALPAHLERLARSAALLELPLPADLATLRRWSEEALAANEATDCVLRIVVIGPENGGEAAAFIWPQPLQVYPTEYFTLGVSAITYEGQRAMPTAKSLDTLVNFLARRRAQELGAHEGLLYHDGRLTEGSNSNLFAVVDGELLTPPAGEVLSGVSRDIVLKLAAEHEIPAREAPLPLAGIARWSECFITSTSRHVMPITTIDGHAVGSGRVGPLTRRLMALFEGYFAHLLTSG